MAAVAAVFGATLAIVTSCTTEGRSPPDIQTSSPALTASSLLPSPSPSLSPSPSWSPTDGVSPSPAATSALPSVVDRQVVFGQSVRGVALVATELGNPQLPALLVVGSIHGDEPAGVAVVDAIAAVRPTSDEHLWLVRTLNPDGLAAGTRGNAHGVDLNRNFPDSWRPLTGRQFAGVKPLSEPESAALDALLRRISPRVGIWFHQPLGVIDISQGPGGIEHYLASTLQVPERVLQDYPGSAIGYEDRLWPDTAFAFELPAGHVTSARAEHIAAAILAVSRGLPGTPTVR